MREHGETGINNASRLAELSVLGIHWHPSRRYERILTVVQSMATPTVAMRHRYDDGKTDPAGL